MDRRKSIKTIALSVVAPTVLLKENTALVSNNHLIKKGTDKKENQSFTSKWSDWPDMNWAGPEYWGNRLQDWRLKDGKLECLVKGRNRTLHCLTTQLSSHAESFETSVNVRFLADPSELASNYYAGF